MKNVGTQWVMFIGEEFFKETEGSKPMSVKWN
jgi:hypothetical protein